MDFEIESRVVRIDSDGRYIIKGILNEKLTGDSDYSKLISKFNKSKISLNDEELMVIHCCLVSALKGELSDDERNFIDSFICNVN